MSTWDRSPRTCGHIPCGQVFTPNEYKQKYHQPICGERARSATTNARRRAKLAATPKVTGRKCQDCGASIDGMNHNAIRCRTCAPKRQNSLRTSISERTGKRVRQKSGNLQRSEPHRLTKEKAPSPKMPDLGAGEGFTEDGWTGCWSPNIPPDGPALIEKHLGRPDPMKKRSAAA